MDGRYDRGFTMIELVAVIIIIGILAALSMSRCVGPQFQARGVHDSLASALRYAQKRAIASNCPASVQFAPDGKSYTVHQHGKPDCSAASVAADVGMSDTGYIKLTPSRTPITFLASGAANCGGSGNPTIGITGAATIEVVCATGYVKAN